MNEEYFTVAEVAKRLKVTPQAVYKWISQKRLHAVYVGSERRITSSAIEEFVRNSTRAAEVDSAGSMENDTLMPSLVAA